MFHADEICTSCGLVSRVFDTWASILARKQSGRVHESLRTSGKSSLLNPVRFGQLLHEPASGTRVSSCLSNGADASCSRMFDSIHAAKFAHGNQHLAVAIACPHAAKGRVKASCCCEAGSLAISKAWPMVICVFQECLGHGRYQVRQLDATVDISLALASAGGDGGDGVGRFSEFQE